MTQEAFNMALTAQDSNHRSQIHAPSDISSRQSHHNPHLTVDTLAAQVTDMVRTVDEITTRLHRLKGKSPPTNTAISHSDTSRTRESEMTNISALTYYTDRTTPDTYTKQRHSRHAATNHSPRVRTRSPSDSPRYRSPPHWESPPQSNPTDEYFATNIMPDGILLWSEYTLTTHENPSARYCCRIYQVTRAMVEHNRISTKYTTE